MEDEPRELKEIMKNLLEKIKSFEDRNNISALVILYSDGSNQVKEFWESSDLSKLDRIDELEQFLDRATYEKADNGRMKTPAKLVCSLCKSPEPCPGINNIEPCFLLDEQRRFSNGH